MLSLPAVPTYFAPHPRLRFESRCGYHNAANARSLLSLLLRIPSDIVPIEGFDVAVAKKIYSYPISQHLIRQSRTRARCSCPMQDAAFATGNELAVYRRTYSLHSQTAAAEFCRN